MTVWNLDDINQSNTLKTLSGIQQPSKRTKNKN